MLVEIDSATRLQELLIKGDEIQSASRLLFVGESITDNLESSIGQAIAAATSLVELAIVDTAASDGCLARLVDQLGRRATLESLTFSGAAGDKTATAVAQALVRLPALADLGLDETRIGEFGLRELARHFEDSPQLQVLRLARINATDTAFAECIRSLPKGLELLELFDNSMLGEQSATALSDVLPAMTNLEYLSISMTGVTVDGVSRILQAGSPSLRELHLTGLDVGSALADAPKRFPSLSKLSIREAGITDTRCAAVAAWLRRSSLRELDLRYNRGITSSGVKLLAAEASAETELQALDLGLTSCGNEGLLALVEAFSGHASPPVVDLSCTELTAAVLSEKSAVASSLVVDLGNCQGVPPDIRFPCPLSQACEEHRKST